MKRKVTSFHWISLASLLFVMILFIIKPDAGKTVSRSFFTSSLTMLKILPFTFILVSLFEVWIEKEKVEKHLGKKGGFVSFVWAIALGGTTVGPLIVAFPVAVALARKGARLSVVFTYIGASAVCRIAMTVFESSYLGLKFTIIRYAVSIPLIIISSVILGRVLERKGYQIRDIS